MAPDSYEAPEGYLTLAAARARLGVSRATFAKILGRANLTIYQDQRDARVKLLKLEDVESLRQPIPMPKARETRRGKAKAA